MSALFDIMHRNFPFKSDDIEVKSDVRLTSPKIGFNNMELYELLMCIEARFSVSFEPQEIRSKGFDTLNKICDLVCKKLS